ncbi:MAG: FecR family protein [Treponema sp.]|jgi:hypothetical protein|nr:FecR family protein [Treponema sp.]
MKKNVFFALLLAAAVFRVFAQSPDFGQIREFTGEVELKRAGSAVFVKAGAGDLLTQDTIVSTGFKSTAIIEVGSSTIMVRPLTRLSLAGIQSDSGAEKLNVNLQTGRIKVDVKPPAGTKSNVSVQGSSATASVRGTSFEFDGFNLFVNEGAVSFESGNGVVILVSQNEGSSANGYGGVSDPQANNTNGLVSPFPVGASPDRTTPTMPPSAGDINIDIRW